MIGDFLGAVGNGNPRPTPALEMHESELGFQAIIDPYARADFFLSFGETGVEPRRGLSYVSGAAGRAAHESGQNAGGFRQSEHASQPHAPWTDRPLVTQNLVGGEEGIGDAGLSVQPHSSRTQRNLP